jgi:hypothetical protein
MPFFALEGAGRFAECDSCSTPVVRITHTNSKLKNAQAVHEFISASSEGEVTIDVTVVPIPFIPVTRPMHLSGKLSLPSMIPSAKCAVPVAQ